MARNFTEKPVLIIVRRGRKLIRSGGEEHVIEAGSALALAEGLTFDVVNTPDKKSGLYEADWLAFAPELTRRFAEGNISSHRIRCAHVFRTPGPAFEDAFKHAQTGILREQEVPKNAAVARIMEVLEWLYHCGGHFAEDRKSTTSRLVRLKLASDLAANWTTPLMAKRLGLSEATLRRRLAKEGSSFNDLLVEARMVRALTFLQSSDLPVGQIALEVGYESPSRFSARFKERFGYSPSAVRTAPVKRRR